MPRFSNIKDTLIEINKMNSQTGTRYRESGLVPWPYVAVRNIKSKVRFEDIAWSGRNEILKFEICRSDHQ